MLENAKLTKTYDLLIKTVIIIASYAYIYYQVFYSENYKMLFKSFKSLILNGSLLFPFLIIFILMLVNWSLEALKWKYMIAKVEKISFIRSFKAILAGISVSSFTPNRVGEFFGRVFILKVANPWKAIFITLIGSMSQLLITILAGSISLALLGNLYFKTNEQNLRIFFYAALFIISIADICFIMMYFNVSFLNSFINRIIKKRWRRIRSYLNVFSAFTVRELNNVFWLSFLRYCVFTFQFYILLKAFQIPVSLFESVMLTSFIYFAMAAIPTIALAELGIRGSVAVGVITFYFETIRGAESINPLAIIAASSVLWLVNLALPAIVGTFFVGRLHFFSKK